jgi:hypothetical protein
VAAGDPPDELRAGTSAPLYVEASRLQERLRPLKGPDRREFLDLARLDNRAGTGWLPGHLELERGILDQAAALLRQNPPAERLAAFERDAAARALAALRRVNAGEGGTR